MPPKSKLQEVPSPALPPEAGMYQNAYQYIADLTGLSERTIRKAFKREPITWQTACKISKHTGFPTRVFRCIEDTRGMNKKKKPTTKKK